jgi:ABC-2 type transporter
MFRLDEPTSGLDAFTASSILEVLNGLALEGRTVIASIHQSRSDLFTHFGNVLLLAKGGEVVYSGKANQMLPYFADLGYTCPSTTNPADFALDLVSVDLREAKSELSTQKKVAELISNFDSKQHMDLTTPRTISLPAELNKLRREMAPFRVAYPILLRRGIISFRRQPSLGMARIGQVVGMGFTIALFFAPLRYDYYSIQNRLGCIQELLPCKFSSLDPHMPLLTFRQCILWAYCKM